MLPLAKFALKLEAKIRLNLDINIKIERIHLLVCLESIFFVKRQ